MVSGTGSCKGGGGVGIFGVVYGDIGTSPLYALREALVAAGGHKGTGRGPMKRS